MNYLLKRHRCLLGAVAVGLAILTVSHPHLIACNSALNSFISNAQTPILAVIVSINAASLVRLYGNSLSIEEVLKGVEKDHPDLNAAPMMKKIKTIQKYIFSNVFWLLFDLSASILIVIVKHYFSGEYAVAVFNSLAVYVMIDGLMRLALMIEDAKTLSVRMHKAKVYEDSEK